jgi:CheY-like chemotaxis protein
LVSDKIQQKILIVDDLEENIRILERLLAREGYQTIVAQSGREALTLAKTSQPDLILMDVVMPGLSGFEACELLKKEPDLNSIPVVFVSTNTQKTYKQRGFEAGGADYVGKPFSRRKILRVIKKNLPPEKLSADSNDM